MQVLAPIVIRQALVQIAERNRRPHYDLVVQKAVIEAFRTNQPHHLKEAVLSEPVVSNHILSDTELRLSRAKRITNIYGMTNALAVASNLNVTFLNQVILGHVQLTDEIWGSIEKGIELIEKYPERYEKHRKSMRANKRPKAKSKTDKPVFN